MSFLSNLGAWGNWGAEKLYNAYNAVTNPFGDLGELNIGPSDVPPPESEELQHSSVPIDDPVQDEQAQSDYDEHADPLEAVIAESEYSPEELEHLANGAPSQGPIDQMKVAVINGVLGDGTVYESTVQDKRGLGARALNAAGETLIGHIAVENLPYSDRIRELTAWGIIGSTDFEKLATEKKAELNELVANPRLGMALDASIPKIAGIVKEKVSQKYPGFGPFLDKEGPRLEKIVRGILYRVLVNFARDTKEKLTQFDPAKTDLTTEIIKSLLRISNRQMRDIAAQDKFDEIDAMHLSDMKKVAFRELFGPAVDEFVKIALPNGKDDFGMRGPLAEGLWNAVVTEMLPDMFVDIYRLEHKQPFHTEEDLKILEQKGGAALKHIAEVTGKELSEVLPKLLAKEADKLAQEGLEGLEMTNALWLKTWIGGRIAEFATSDDPEIKELWGFAKKNIESVMIHALASLAGSEEVGPDGNLIPVVAGKGLKIFDDFIAANQEAIDAVDAKPITDEYTIKQRTEEREKLFKPLVDTIIRETHLSHNRMIGLVDSEKLVRKIMPKLLSKIYEDMKAYKGSQPDEEGRLFEALSDPDAYINQAAQEVVQGADRLLPRGLDVRARELEAAAVNQTVEELSAACGILAEDVAKIARKSAEKNTGQFIHLMNKGLFKDNKLTPEEEKDFADGMQQFLQEENPSLDKTWDYVQSLIQATIFKVFVRVAENNPGESDDPTTNKNLAIPGNVIHRVLTFLADRMPEVDAAIEEIRNSDMSKADKKKEILKLFQPIAAEFLDLAGESLKEMLPVPKMFRKFLATKLREEYLPAIFSKMYKDLNGWRYDAPKQEAQLDTLFPDENGKKAATNIANFVRDLVPYYLETNPGKVTELMEKNVLGKYFAVLSPEHQASVRALVEKNVKDIGLNPAMKTMAEGIGEYSRGIFLKMFAGVTQNIADKEKPVEGEGKNKFLLNMSLGMIRLLGDHVRRINKIPPAGRMYPAHQVPHDAMLDGFANHPELPSMLHPALAKDLDPYATEEERKEQRLNEFFIPFASDLLAIAGMKEAPEDFPAPSYMRQEAWEMFKTKLLPETLMNVYQEMLKPENLNMMMLKTVDSLIEGIDALPDEAQEDTEVEDDPEQRQLNEALGDVIKEMVDLMPDIWTKTIITSDRIRNMTSESLGRIVRRKLDSTSMIEIINKGLAGLKLNKPDADRGKTDKELSAEKAKIEKELNKKMTSYMSRQVKDALKNMMKTKWDAFQAKFDRGVQKAFGKPGLAIKRFFDVIFHFIFLTVLGPVFNFTLYKCLWYFVEKKIESKAREIIKDIHMPINENVLLNFTQSWLDAMKGVEEAQHHDRELIRENQEQRRAREIDEDQTELHEEAVQEVVEENLQEAGLVDEEELSEDEETQNLNGIIEQQRSAALLQERP